MRLAAPLAILLLVLPAVPQEVLVQNVATLPQRQWTFVGLPDDVVPRFAGVASSTNPDGPTASWRYVPVQHGVWIDAEVPAGAAVRANLLPAADVADVDPAAAPVDRAFGWRPESFRLHDALVTTGLAALLPTFAVESIDGTQRWTSEPLRFWPAGGPRPPLGFVRLLESSQAHQVWHARTRVLGAAITVDWWARITSASATIEFTVHLAYGDVATPGQPISSQLGAASMDVAAEPHVDFRARVGLPAAEPLPSGWRQVLMPPADWGRASRVEVRGAVLVADDPPRRQGRPLCGVFTGWDGKWLALGQVPDRAANATTVTAARLATYLSPPAGNMYDQRPECQPKVSGTTGEQVDFGACSCEEVVTCLSAWAVHDNLFQCQGYAMRPTANKEANGDPVRVIDHPHAVCFGQRPDDRFSDEDPLGWYWPPESGRIPYSWPGSGYTAGDGEHRSENKLVGTIALTRDPALLAILADHVELQGMEMHGRYGAPREVGRVMLAQANQLWLGFEAAREQMRATVDLLAQEATMASLPPDKPVRIIAGNELAKYGWFNANGQHVIGWQGWQEVIAAIGLAACARVSGDDRARAMAVDLCRTATEQCWYEHEGRLLHTYAQRWRAEDPGAAHPGAAFYPQSATTPNYDVNTDSACDYWTRSGSYLLLVLAPEDRGADRARELVAADDPTPRNWNVARWRAVGRPVAR